RPSGLPPCAGQPRRIVRDIVVKNARVVPRLHRFPGRNAFTTRSTAPLPGRECAEPDNLPSIPNWIGTFLQLLPSNTPMACALENGQPNMMASVADGSTPRILIADDQADLLDALRLLLKGQGIDYDAVTSPDAALEALQARAFDLVLMDLNYTGDTTSGRE